MLGFGAIGEQPIGIGPSASAPSGKVLVAAAGAFVLTGSAAALVYDRIFSVSAGSFVLTGESAGLLRGYILAAMAGVFALVGEAANLIVGGGGVVNDWMRRKRRRGR